MGRLLQELQEALGDAEEATQLLMSQQCVHCLLCCALQSLVVAFP